MATLKINSAGTLLINQAGFLVITCQEILTLLDCSVGAPNVCTNDEMSRWLEVTITKSGSAPTGCTGSECNPAGTYCLEGNCGGTGCGTINTHTWQVNTGTYVILAWVEENTSDGHWYFGLHAAVCGGAACGAFTSAYNITDHDFGTSSPNCTNIFLSGSGGSVTPNSAPWPCNMQSAADYSWTAKSLNC